MSYEDERVVKLSFDNEAFKKGVADTLVALKNLEKALDVDPKTASKSFDNLSASMDLTEKSMSNLEAGVEKVKIGFSMLEVAGITMFANLTTAAMQFGRTLYTQTIGQIQSGGFSRALNLENAKFQIEGLDKSWGELKDDILYGVKDTAYGLDEAAKIAAQLSASNIKAGNEMKTSLRAISGVAAMTNSSYSDIGEIFTTMAAQGRVMGHELTRLSYRGLNAAAAIAKYNKEIGNSALDTEAKVRDMASKGKISYQQFAAAMNKVFGEHATEANKTFTGAMSNMRAALSRLGEAMQSPKLDIRRRLAVAVIPAIDKLTSAVNKLVVPTFTKVLDIIATWGEKLLQNYSFMKFIYNVVIGVYSWIQNILRALWELGLIVPDVQSVAKGLADMTEWMVLNGERGEKFRNVIKTLARGFQTLLTVIDAIIYVLEPIYKPILNFLKSLVSSVGTAAGETEDLFTRLQNGIKIISYFMRLGLEQLILNVVKAIRILIGVIQLLGIAIAAIIVGFAKFIKAMYNFVRNVSDYIKYCVENIEWLGKAIKTLYKMAVAVLENLVKGIKGFAGILAATTAFVWDKISWLFQDRTMKTTVVVDAIVPKIGADSIIQNDAANSINNTAKAYGKYSSAATEAAKAGQKASDEYASFKVSAAGGSMNGLMGVRLDNDGGWAGLLKRKLEEVDDETEQVNNSVDNLAKGFGDSFDQIDKDVDKSKLFNKDSDFGSNFISQVNAVVAGTNALQGISPIWKGLLTIILVGGVSAVNAIKYVLGSLFDLLKTSLKAIPDTVEAIASGLSKVIIIIFGSIADIITSMVKTIGEHPIKSLWAIFKIIQTIILVSAVASRIGDAKVFEWLTKYLIAFTGVLVVTGLIAKLVDPKQFAIVAKTVMLFGAVLSMIVALIGVFTFITVLVPLINKILNMTHLTITTKISALQKMFGSIAILCAVVLSFVFGFIAYFDNVHGGDFSMLWKVGGLLLLGIGIMLAMVVAIVKLLGDYSYVKTSRELEGRVLGWKKYSHNMEAGLYGLVGLLSSLSTLIFTLGSVVFALSFRSGDKVAKILFNFGLSVVIIIGGLLAFVIVMTAITKKMDPAKLEIVMSRINRLMLSMSLFMYSIKGILLVLALTTFILSGVSSYKMTGVIAALLVITGSIAGLMIAYATAIRILSNISFTEKSISFAKISALLLEFIVGMSGLILVIAISTRILASANESALLKSAGVMFVLINTVARIATVMMMAMKYFATVKVDNVAAMATTFADFAGIMGIMTGAIISIVIAMAGLATMIDKLSDISSLYWSIGIITGILFLFIGLYLLINKTANLMPSLQSVYGLAILTGAMTAMIIGIAVFIKILSTIDWTWQLVAASVVGIITALTSMVLLSKFITGGALIAIKEGVVGLLIIVGFIGTIVGLVALLGKAIGFVGQNIVILAQSLDTLTKVNWFALKDTAIAMKSAITELVKAITVSLDIKSVAGILVLSLGLKMLSDSIKYLGNIKPEQLTAFAVTIKMILETFANNWQGALIALAFTALFSAIGWSLAIGMLGFIIFAALVPVMVKAVNSAITALANLNEITIDVSKYMELIKNLIPLAAELALFGVLLSVGGVGLAIGAGALLVGIWLMNNVFETMESSNEGMTRLNEYLKSWFSVGFGSVVVGILFSTGAGMLAIGAVLMIAALGIMHGCYALIKKDFSKIDMAVGYMGGLFVLSLVTIGAASTLILSSALLTVAGVIFLLGCGTLSLSLLALQKAFENSDVYFIKQGLNDIMMLGETFSDVGKAMQSSLPPFIDGMFMLALAMGGFAVAGIELLVGAATFSAGLVIISDAFEKVDPKVITKNIKDIGIFVGSLAVIGVVMAIALIPFTLAAGLFSLAAGMIAIGIVALSISLTIGSASLLASFEMLNIAFDKMNEAFEKVGYLDLLSIAGKLAVLGIGIVIASVLFSLAGLPFVIGTALLLAGAAILSVAMDKLSQALELKKIGKVLVGAGILIAALLVFALISPILVVAGLAFIVFAAELIAGAAIISMIGSVISEGLDGIYDLFDDFYDAADYIIEGLIEGLKNGLDKVLDVVAGMAGEILDKFCEILGINSPAEEFIKAAAYCIAGIAEGLGMDHDEVYNKIYDLGMGMLDTFEGFENPLGSIAESLGLTGGNGMLDGLCSSLFGDNGLESILNMFGDSYGAGLSAIFGAGNQAMIDQLQAQYDQLQAEMKYEYQHENRDSVMKNLSEQAGAVYAELDAAKRNQALFEFDIPSFDDFNRYPGGGGTPVSSETSEALSELGSSSGGSHSDLAKSAGTNVGNSITNNNYNFIQNNYSPEPIDRTELYTQTKNQLDDWYKFVRDNG